MRGITCRVIAAMPPDAELNRVLARHRDQCPRCRAATALSGGVSRELQSLGLETVAAPEGMTATIMTRLGSQDGSDPRRPLVARLAIRWSAAGLIGLATVAAVGARIFSRRKR